jgi:Ca-activated chloride channel family protein
MSFAHPWLLLFLLFPLAMLVRGWRGHGVEVVMPYDHGNARPRKLLTFTLRLAAALPAFLLAITVVLLAGPQRFSEPLSRRVMTNIEFLVDVSGSMTSPYGDGNRYDAAMANIMKFIDARKGDAYGLTVFGSDVLHWVPLTTDPSALKCAPPFLSPMKLPRWFGGGTLIGKGLEACIASLQTRGEGDRMIILLTDGYSFDLANGNDEVLARKLNDANIRVFCIHIDNSEPPPEVQLIASQTGGQTFGAGDATVMPAVFQRIDQMAKTRVEKISGETLDDFQPWSLAGGSILLCSILASFGIRYTPW